MFVLVPPAVISPRLDHDRTRLYAVNSDGLWLITPACGRASSMLIANAYADAQQLVSAAGTRPEMLTRARGQAQSVLAGVFEVTGWKITIRWSDGWL